MTLLTRPSGARALLGLALIALSLALGLLILSTAAVAQETTPEATDAATETPEADDCTEQIDRFVRLCSASYDAESGEARITLEAEASQPVTLTDATGVMEGGEVNRRRATVVDRSTVAIDATSFKGQVAVTVDTGRTLYAVPIESGSSLQSPHESDWLALLAGVLIVPGSAFAVKRRRDRKRRKGVIRVDG